MHAPSLTGRRRASQVRVSSDTLVTTRPPGTGHAIPLIVEPATPNFDLAAWTAMNRPWIAATLGHHGALLFRGFEVPDAEAFERVMVSACGPPMPYGERSSPRSTVSGAIYTSTDYPSTHHIFPHNEQSYNLTFPLRIAFCCLQPATHGGRTPIVDTRRVLERIPVPIRQRFLRRRYLLVRHFGDGLGLRWQTVFQTEDRAAVEAYCRQAAIDLEWGDGDRLRTRQIRDTVARHPETGALSWFNHLTFFHASTLPADIRREFDEDQLPTNTCYGDGAPIESEVLDLLRAAYAQETVEFDWQAQDILLLDNVLCAHARTPYQGPRRVVVAMADPCHWDRVRESPELHLPTENRS